MRIEAEGEGDGELGLTGILLHCEGVMRRCCAQRSPLLVRLGGFVGRDPGREEVGIGGDRLGEGWTWTACPRAA
jgi:hypothetical protein